MSSSSPQASSVTPAASSSSKSSASSAATNSVSPSLFPINFHYYLTFPPLSLTISIILILLLLISFLSPSSIPLSPTSLFYAQFSSPSFPPLSTQCLSSSFSPSTIPLHLTDDFSPTRSTLLSLLRDGDISFIGDSILREIYYEFLHFSHSSSHNIINEYQPLSIPEVNKRYKNRHVDVGDKVASTSVKFYYKENFEKAAKTVEGIMKKFIDIEKSNKDTAASTWTSYITSRYSNDIVPPKLKPRVLVFSMGFHDLLYSDKTNTTKGIDTFFNMIRKYYTLPSSSSSSSSNIPIEYHDHPIILFLSSPYIIEEYLTSHRKNNVRFRNENLKDLNGEIQIRVKNIQNDASNDFLSHRIYYLDMMDFTSHRPRREINHFHITSSNPFLYSNRKQYEQGDTDTDPSSSSSSILTLSDNVNDGIHSDWVSQHVSINIAQWLTCTLKKPFFLTAMQLVIGEIYGVMMIVYGVLGMGYLVHMGRKRMGGKGGENQNQNSSFYQQNTHHGSIKSLLHSAFPTWFSAPYSPLSTTDFDNSNQQERNTLLLSPSSSSSLSSSFPLQNDSDVSDHANSNNTPEGIHQTLASAHKANHNNIGIPDSKEKSLNGTVGLNKSSLPWYDLTPFHFSPSTSSILFLLFTFLSILLYVFLLDGDYRLFPSWIGDKSYSRDFFVFLCFLIMMGAVISAKKSGEKPTPITFQQHGNSLTVLLPGVFLNRDQSEEWKGSMQIIFVLYHYFAAKELYNLIRVFIAAYVFLTGYGNYSFFNKSNDFSALRLVKMLFRLNFLVVLMCFIMNREWVQYYVCPLHTFYFLIVYGVMRVKSQWNGNLGYFSIKLLSAAGILYALFECNSTLHLFQLLFSYWPYQIFEWNHSLYEWYFRSKLDHYIVLVGMFVGCALGIVEKLLYRLEFGNPFGGSGEGGKGSDNSNVEMNQLNGVEEGKGSESVPSTASSSNSSFPSILFHRHFLYISTLSLSLFILYLWTSHILFLPKLSYNILNPYTTFIPIIIYLYIRNCHSVLRSNALFLFTWCGRITLESYILQFHVWLSNDAASILVIWELYPLVNFVFFSATFIFLSYQLFLLTNQLNEFIFFKGLTTREMVQGTATLMCGVTIMFAVNKGIVALVWG